MEEDSDVLELDYDVRPGRSRDDDRNSENDEEDDDYDLVPILPESWPRQTYAPNVAWVSSFLQMRIELMSSLLHDIRVEANDGIVKKSDDLS